MNDNEKYIDKQFAVILLINTIIFLPLLIFGGENYSIDSYSILLNQNEHITNFIGAYRYFGALVYKMVMLFNHNPILNATFDVVIFILLASAITSMLVRTIVRITEIKSKIAIAIIDVAVLISVFNVWFCNLLSFPECIILTIVGLVLCFGAIIVYVTSETWKSCLISGLMLICSTAVYQQFISVYTIFVIAILGIKILKEHVKSFKEIVIVYIKPVVTIVASGTIYFILGKTIANLCGIQANSRIALSLDLIVENIKYFVNNQHSFLKGRGYFTTEFLTFSFVGIGILWFILLIQYWMRQKHTLGVLTIWLSYIAAYVVAYLPGILSTSHAARAMFALFSIFLLFTLGIVAMINSKCVQKLILVWLVAVLVVNMLKVVECEVIQKKQNQQDEEWAIGVVAEIDNYEKSSGYEVEQIIYRNDLESDGYTESARNVTYAMKALLTIHAEKEFTFLNMPDEVYREKFADKNWDYFVPDEQLVFVEDTLYICCY